MGLFGDFSDMFITPFTENSNKEVNRYSRELMDYANHLDPNQLQSAFQGMSTDPATKAAQLKALAQLGVMADSNGNDEQAQAMMFDANNQSAGYEKAQRGAIQNDMNARGMGGSGAELASLLSAQQQGADRSHAGGVHAASESRRRAMEALGQMGNLASGMRGQDWNEKAGRASALDAMTRAKYNGQLDKYGALSNSYGFGKETQRANAARDAAMVHSTGKFMDTYGSMIGGGMSGMGGGGGGGMMSGMMGGGGGGKNPKNEFMDTDYWNVDG